MLVVALALVVLALVIGTVALWSSQVMVGSLLRSSPIVGHRNASGWSRGFESQKIVDVRVVGATTWEVGIG